MRRVAIVMAGGSGERFWPLSTPDQPKQLLDLTGAGASLLEQAITRVRPVVDEVFVSTTERLVAPILDSGLADSEQVLAEPSKRNTAGALVWCMAQIASRIGEPFIAAVTTADHAIGPDDAFRADVAAALARSAPGDSLVTLGIPPTRPETGFGYLEVADGDQVARFVEKPDLERAAQYVADGRHLWNSGMFFWRSDRFLAELETASPVHAEAFKVIASGDAERGKAAFEALPNISIDYALMEKAAHVAYVRASFAWDDVGSWDALLRTVPLDPAGNAIVGAVTALDASGCVAYNATDRPVCLLGTHNAIVVATETAFLVAPIGMAQEVRNAAQKMS